MLKIDVSNDKYIFLFCDGFDNNMPSFSDEDLKDKQLAIFIDQKLTSIPKYKDNIIEQINELLRRNQMSNNILILPNNNTFDFNKELSFEELFYEKYDNIEQPERINIRTLDYFETDDNKMAPVYTTYPLPYCKNIDDKINLFAADIKDSSLSNFEKALATYIICTHFMDTCIDHETDGKFIITEATENIYSSSMHILSDNADGYKIKCGGYVDLFSRIMKKMNITSKPMLLLNKNNLAHIVSLVDIKDEKYGIDGTYVCDLRTDSDLRAIIENSYKESGVDTRKYGTFNSLAHFCMNSNDCANLLGLNRFNTPTFYLINSSNCYNNCDCLVSKERIETDTIEKALSTVNDHIYFAPNNVNKNNEAINEISSAINREKNFIERMRKLADKNAVGNNKKI